MIFGMDPWVFAAWILTILTAIFCVIYGIYYEFIKKTDEEKIKPMKKKKINKKQEGK